MESLQHRGQGPVPDDQGVLGGSYDPLSPDLVAQVLDMVLEKLGLLGGVLEANSPEGGQDLEEDPEMTPGIG